MGEKRYEDLLLDMAGITLESECQEEALLLLKYNQQLLEDKERLEQTVRLLKARINEIGMTEEGELLEQVQAL